MDAEEKKKLEPFRAELKNRFFKWIYSSDAPPPSKGQIPSQTQFADYLGIDSTSLSYYMTGNRKPAQEQAQRMADKLGPKIMDLLDYARTLPRNPVIIALVDEAMELPDKRRRELLELAKDMKVQEEAADRQRKQQIKPVVQH